MKMETGLGMWICILGVAAIVVGGAMYGAAYSPTTGLGILGLGIILVIAGTAWWKMKGKKAPMTASTQPAKPATTS